MSSTTAARLRPGMRLGLQPGLRPRRPAFDLRTLWGDALVFLISAASFLDITLIGKLPYSEIFTLVLLPALLATKAKVIFRKEYRTFYILMGLWLLNQVITDVYREMPLDNRVKGVARVVFFAIDLMVLSSMVGTNLRRIRLFFLGMAISGFAAFFLSKADKGDVAVAWKMGLGDSAAFFLLLIVSYHYSRKGKNSLSVLSLLGVAAVYLHYGARSGELKCVAAAVLLLLPPFSPAKHGSAMRSLGRLAKVALLLAAAVSAAWLSQQTIHWMVHSGYYSQSEINKFENQSQGKMGVIFGGRPEVPVAIRAIMDSPILGHGSYASDIKYTIMMQDYQYEWGYNSSDATPDPDEPEGIPTHSHLTGAWVEAGFMGGVFWFYVLGLICRSLFQLTEVRHPLAPLYLLFFIGFFWDILFSPFGNTRRITEAFAIVLMVNLVRKPPVPRWKTGWPVRWGQPVLRQQPLWRRPLTPGMRPSSGAGRGLRPRLPRVDQR